MTSIKQFHKKTVQMQHDQARRSATTEI